MDNNDMIDIIGMASKNCRKQMKSLTDPRRKEELKEILDLIKENPFFSGSVFEPSTLMCFYLYTKNQLHDIVRCCQQGNSIWSVYKTVKLSHVFLTITVFENLGLQNADGSHPLFLGPILIHERSNYQAFQSFFSHLSIRLPQTICDNIIFGIDSKGPLYKGINSGYHRQSPAVILCCDHMKTTLTNYLKAKIGLDIHVRNEITNKVMELLQCKEEVAFDNGAESIINFCQEMDDISDESRRHLIQHISNNLESLKENVWHLRDRVKLPWVNKASEVLNDITRYHFTWKQQKIPKLIDIFYESVLCAYGKCQAALAGASTLYTLSPEYKQFQVTPEEWERKSKQEKEQILLKFCSNYEKVRSPFDDSDEESEQ